MSHDRHFSRVSKREWPMVTMSTDTDPVEPIPGRRPLRTVAIVSQDPHAAMLDTVLEAGDYDVLFIESVCHAYSQIKRVTPDVVILCLDMDDADGCRLLSMLSLDDATSSIPVVMYVTPPAASASSEQPPELDREMLSLPITLSRN